jgi:hypothetical protein
LQLGVRRRTDGVEITIAGESQVMLDSGKRNSAS